MKTNRYLILTAALVFFGLSGCLAGSKASAGGADMVLVENANETEEVSFDEALDAALMDQPRYGNDSVKCVTNWSLYAEYYKQRNYPMSIDPWRWMFFNCPLATQNLYIHGATLVKFMYQNETDPIKREAYVDTLMMVYDQRIQYFNREGYVLGRKVADLYVFRPNEAQSHYDISERSIELEANGSQADVLLINFQATIRLAEAGLLDPEKIVINYDRAMDYIDFNLLNNPEDSIYFNPAKNNIEALFEPYASCENLVKIYTPRFEASPEDPELLDKITFMLDRSGCTGEELFYKATRNFHKLNPTAQSAFLMGRLENNLENYADALEYYEQAIELGADQDEPDKFTTYMLMADLLYRNLNRMSQARTYALRAAEVNPDDGRPYLLIGELYAASARSCGTDEVSTGAVYWAAVDKFIRARNVDDDPDVVARANQLISTFSQYFPNNEILFFHGLDGGKSYNVGCWINETTTARPRP
ncbi:MAG: tetratricopeptide repeat protein [Bacteroides sp.]|jgi:tetratricopeptide (TPR) repeat protein|nr:tetratricopeptide repeat protein [Bacteroides sp.]